MEVIGRLRAAAVLRRRHGQGQGVLAQLHQVIIADALVGLRRHIRSGGDGLGPFADGCGHGRVGLSGNGPDVVIIPSVTGSAAGDHDRIVLRKVICCCILRKVVGVQQDGAVRVCRIDFSHNMAAQPQRGQAFGAGCRRHVDGVGLGGTVLRRNREGHGAVGEVHYAVGGGNGGAGADGGGNGHIGQIRAIGQHKVIVAVLVQQSRATVDGQARQVAGVVLQRLEAIAHRQILTFAAALLPHHAVQGDVGIAVQLVHELLSLHGGQGHGGGTVARVIVTDGGHDALLFIVQVTDALLIVTNDYTSCVQVTDQVARHRLRFLRAVLDGTGMVAVEHADHVAALIAGRACIGSTHKAAHGGLFHLDGTQVIAVLHEARQLAHQTASLLTGVDDAVVGAAGDNTQRVFCRRTAGSDAASHTADQHAAGNGAIVAAVAQNIGISRDAAYDSAAVSAETAGIRIAGNLAVVGAIDQVLTIADNTAHHQIGDAAREALRTHGAVVDAILDASTTAGRDTAHIGLGGNGAALIQNNALYHSVLAQHAKQSEIAGLRIVVNKVLDAIAAAIIGAVKRTITTAIACSLCDRRPVGHTRHIDVSSLLIIDARCVFFVVVDVSGNRRQSVKAVDNIRVCFRSGACIIVYFLRNVEGNIQRDGVAISIGRYRQCFFCQI